MGFPRHFCLIKVSYKIQDKGVDAGRVPWLSELPLPRPALRTWLGTNARARPLRCPKLSKVGSEAVLSLETAVINSSTSIAEPWSEAPRDWYSKAVAGFEGVISAEALVCLLRPLRPEFFLDCFEVDSMLEGCWAFWRCLRFWEAWCFLTWKRKDRGKWCLSTRCWCLLESLWNLAEQPSTRHSYCQKPRYTISSLLWCDKLVKEEGHQDRR